MNDDGPVAGAPVGVEHARMTPVGAERARTTAPFGRRLLKVTGIDELGAYRILRVADPDGGAPAPGQFAMLAAAERWGGGEDERPYLARAFSIARWRDGEAHYLMEDVGPGTRRLCELAAGDRAWVLGPLGRGFSAPPDGRRALLVGGGVGIAPLAIWQDVLEHPAAGESGPADSPPAVAGPGDLPPAVAGPEDSSPAVAGPGDLPPAVAGPGDSSPAVAGPGDLPPAVAGPEDSSPAVAGPGDLPPAVAGPGDSSPAVAGPGDLPPAVAGPEVTVLLGFRDGPRAEGAALLRGARVATDDGSAGRHGFVTDLLAEELERDAHVTVYACGPAGMLEAVRGICTAEGVPAQLALEAGMACGFGACYGCVVPKRGGGYLRVCVDGPVIDAAELDVVEAHAGGPGGIC